MRHPNVIAVFVLLASGSSPGGECVPPANEECDGATVFTTDDLPYADAGLLGCENNVSDQPYWDVFYRYDCTVTGDHTIDMCGTADDGSMRIYADGCGFGAGSVVAEGDDGCVDEPNDPQITVALEAGVSYWIELGNWRPSPPFGAANNPYVLNVVLAGGPCPGDATGDGYIDFMDILAILALWGPCEDPCLADFDMDGAVTFADLLVVLGEWGGTCDG